MSVPREKPRRTPGRRVVVTGLGLVCSAGLDPESHLAHLLEGQTGLRPIGRFSTEGIKTEFGGEIDDQSIIPGLSESERSGLSRATRFALSASRRALRDSRLTADHLEGGRVGLVAGICASGESGGELSGLAAENPQHTLTDALAAKLGINGPRATISTACASSGSAMGYAFDWLQSGRADAVLVGGADELLRSTLGGFNALGALAVEPCSPFSEGDGIGVTFGEGGVFLLIETEEFAAARQAVSLGTILGYALTGDAYHYTKPHPAGDGLRRAIERALVRSGVDAAEVGYVNAHGTGTVDNDTSESNAARQVFGAGTVPPMSSTKSFFGHTLGPACLLEAASSLLAVNRGYLPPTLHFTSARPGCDLDYIPNQARPAEVDVFLSNSAAFGGVNATVVMGRNRPRPVTDRLVDSVVITGVGVVSPLGHGFEAFGQALSEVRSAIGGFAVKSSGRAVDAQGSRFAGLPSAQVTDWKPRSLVPSLDLRRAEPIAQFSLVAAGLALKHASLGPGSSLDPDRVGVVLALTRGPIAAQERFRERLDARGPAGLGAQDFPPMVVSTITGQMAEAFQLRGINSTLIDGTSAGLHGLCHAVEALQLDDGLDALVVIAADELGPLSMKIELESGRLSASIDGLRPYDPGSLGSIPGEGAVAIVIERAQSAASRGARPLARIGGFGLASSIKPDGSGTAEALLRAASDALGESNVSASEVDLIVGSGRGLPAYDAAECKAMGRLMADRTSACPVTALAALTGVPESSSGLLAVVAALRAITRSEAPAMGQVPAASWPTLEWVGPLPRLGRYSRVLVVGGTDAGNCAAVILDAEAEAEKGTGS